MRLGIWVASRTAAVVSVVPFLLAATSLRTIFMAPETAAVFAFKSIAHGACRWGRWCDLHLQGFWPLYGIAYQ
eukprot:COSAG02_NODE_5547_length_4237_cov_1.952392_5_plen_73_part_00